MRRTGVLILAVAVSCGCGLDRGQPGAVASVWMACTPISDGVRCRLIALFRDVSQIPRDVTGAASWRFSGSVGRMSPDGVVHPVRDGNVDISAQYQGASAHAAARLILGQPGLLLGAIHGSVFAGDNRRLRPVSDVRVEVASGGSAGAQTTTRTDGTYDLVQIVPGETVLRATKSGYEPTEVTKSILPANTTVSLFMRRPHDSLSR